MHYPGLIRRLTLFERGVEQTVDGCGWAVRWMTDRRTRRTTVEGVRTTVLVFVFGLRTRLQTKQPPRARATRPPTTAGRGRSVCLDEISNARAWIGWSDETRSKSNKVKRQSIRIPGRLMKRCNTKAKAKTKTTGPIDEIISRRQGEGPTARMIRRYLVDHAQLAAMLRSSSSPATIPGCGGGRQRPYASTSSCQNPKDHTTFP